MLLWQIIFFSIPFLHDSGCSLSTHFNDENTLWLNKGCFGTWTCIQISQTAKLHWEFSSRILRLSAWTSVFWAMKFCMLLVSTVCLSQHFQMCMGVCLYHIDPINTLELGLNVIHSLAWVSWGRFSSPGNLAWMLLLTIEHPGYFYIYINIRYSDSMRRHYYYFSLLLLQTMDFLLFLLWNYSKSSRYGFVKHLKQTFLWTFVYSKIWFPCQTLLSSFFFDNDTTTFFLPLMGWCR